MRFLWRIVCNVAGHRFGTAEEWRGGDWRVLYLTCTRCGRTREEVLQRPHLEPVALTRVTKI